MQLGPAIVGIVGVVVANVVQAQGVPDFIARDHARIVAAWLAPQPQLRVATDRDCDCDEDLRRVRTESSGVWEADPRFQPYYVVGDFNGDEAKDFAVGVVDRRSARSFRVVVFNGPFTKNTGIEPAFVSELLPQGQALFFGPPRPEPHRLVIGSFESEGAVLTPRLTGYVLAQ